MRDDVHSYKTRNKSIIDTTLSTLKVSELVSCSGIKIVQTNCLSCKVARHEKNVMCH